MPDGSKTSNNKKQQFELKKLGPYYIADSIPLPPMSPVKELTGGGRSQLRWSYMGTGALVSVQPGVLASGGRA